MIDYRWVDWLEALATTIAENGDRDLAERARAVSWGRDDAPLLEYGDENIDPVSFLYFLAQRNTANQFEGVFGSVHEVFDITVEFPESRPFHSHADSEHPNIIPRRQVVPAGFALAPVQGGGANPPNAHYPAGGLQCRPGTPQRWNE